MGIKLVKYELGSGLTISMYAKVTLVFENIGGILEILILYAWALENNAWNV